MSAAACSHRSAPSGSEHSHHHLSRPRLTRQAIALPLLSVARASMQRQGMAWEATMAVMDLVMVELRWLGGHRAWVSEATAAELERLGWARRLAGEPPDPEVAGPVMRLRQRGPARKL